MFVNVRGCSLRVVGVPVNVPVRSITAVMACHFHKEMDRLRQGDKWEDMGLVFPDLRGGYFHPNYLSRVFKKVLRTAGLTPARFHDLRQSAATILLAKGVNIKVIQELLGHYRINLGVALATGQEPTLSYSCPVRRASIRYRGVEKRGVRDREWQGRALPLGNQAVGVIP